MTNTKERKVRDLMIPLKDYDSISQDRSIKDAFGVMEKTGHHAILILGKENEPIGKLSYRDLLIGLEPKYHMRMWGDSWLTPTTFENYPVFYYGGEFSGRCKAEAEKRVAEIMSPLGTAIDADASLAKAVHMMVSENIGRLPVVEGAKIVGMIRLIEIFEEMKKVIRIS